LSLKVSVDVSHERALESHQVNGAPGNVVRYAFDPADQNVFVPAIHDRGREPAMVEAIGGNEKGAFDFRHRSCQRTRVTKVAKTGEFTGDGLRPRSSAPRVAGAVPLTTPGIVPATMTTPFHHTVRQAAIGAQFR
jgi:hypothetical protein